MPSHRLPAEEVLRRQRTQSGRLKEEEVGRIKWLLQNGHTARSLAQAYGMSLWAIRAINRGDTWAWVEPLPPDHELVVKSQGWVPSKEEIDASLARLAKLQQEPESFGEYLARQERPQEGPSLGLAKLTQMAEQLGLDPKLDNELKEFLK